MSKTNSPFLMALVASALVSGLAQPRASMAQDPGPTPIPWQDPPTVVQQATATATAIRNPQSAQLVTWTPNGGNVVPSVSGQVTVQADSSIPFDTSFAMFVMQRTDGTFSSPPQTAGATFSNGNQRVMLTASIPAGSFKGIVFQIKENGNPNTQEKLFSLSRRAYLPLMFNNYEWPPRNLDLTEPNNARCAAKGSLLNGVAYTGSMSQGDDDWYFVDVVAGANLRVAATNIPIPGQMQLFAVGSPDCNQVPSSPTQFGTTSSVDLTLTGLAAGRVYIRFAAVTGTPNGTYQLTVNSDVTNGALEENDNPCQAVTALPGIVYTTFIDDQYDFFALDLPETGTITLNAVNFNVANAQLQLRSRLVDSNCSPTGSTTTLAFAPVTVAGTTVVASGVIPAGRYYARLNLPGATPSGSPAYQFKWTYQASTGSGVWNPNFTTNPTPYVADICLNSSTNTTCTYYWNGMGGNLGSVTEIAIQVVGVSNLTSCPVSGNPSTVAPAPFNTSNWTNVGSTAASGSVTLNFTNASAGGYNVNIRVKRLGQSSDYFDGKVYKRVGTNCGLLLRSAAERDLENAAQFTIVNPDAPVAVPAAP